MSSSQNNNSDKKEESTTKENNKESETKDSTTNNSSTENKTKNEKKEDETKIPVNAKFNSATVVKLGSLMPDSTEVVDVDDVILYKNNFDINDRSHLVPYVIYMDSKFKDVIQTKKRNAMLILIIKIVGCIVVAVGIAFGIKALTG